MGLPLNAHDACVSFACTTEGDIHGCNGLAKPSFISSNKETRRSEEKPFAISTPLSLSGVPCAIQVPFFSFLCPYMESLDGFLGILVRNRF